MTHCSHKHPAQPALPRHCPVAPPELLSSAARSAVLFLQIPALSLSLFLIPIRLPVFLHNYMYSDPACTCACFVLWMVRATCRPHLCRAPSPIFCCTIPSTLICRFPPLPPEAPLLFSPHVPTGFFSLSDQRFGAESEYIRRSRLTRKLAAMLGACWPAHRSAAQPWHLCSAWPYIQRTESIAKFRLPCQSIRRVTSTEYIFGM